MYENMTFRNILKKMLSYVSDDFDKRQGSIIYDALAPICAEIAQIYVDLDIVINEGFADTASRKYLIKRAKERGLEPYGATNSTILAELSGDIKLDGGERFSTDEEVIFFYTGEKEGEYFKLQCEQKGQVGNINYGDMLPIDNIINLSSAKIHKIAISGVDDEDTEIFRKRYLSSFKNQSFGGNRADYIEKISNLNSNPDIMEKGGIGGIKVYRGEVGGNVVVVITNNSYSIPTIELLDSIQQEIDPIESTGEGIGIAPIGHFVKIKAVKEKVINIETNVDIKLGTYIEQFKLKIEKAIDDYIVNTRKEWQEGPQLIIRKSHIESIILKIDGIEDIKNTKINGSIENIILDEDTIPTRGQINVT